MEREQPSHVDVFSYIKQIDKHREMNLDEEPLRTLTSDVDFEMFDKANIANFLTLLYHTEDIFVEKDFSLDKIEDFERSFGNSMVCFKCHEVGHIGRDCPNKQKYLCIYCTRNDHSKSSCPISGCHRCDKFGHSTKACHEPYDRKRFTVCNICTNGPHYVRDCPTPWRGYVFKKYKKTDIVMSCPFCFSNTHFMDDCDLHRTKFTIFTSKYGEWCNEAKKRKRE